jgi:ribosomal protein S18 acetylase RimI-like enzyme
VSVSRKLTAREIPASGMRAVEEFLSDALGRVYSADDVHSVLEESGAGRVMAVSDENGIAMLASFVLSSDGTAQMGAPTFHPRVDDGGAAMLAAAAEEFFRIGATFAHCALPPEDPARDAFVEAGFTPGSLMYDLSRPVAGAPRLAAMPVGARWTAYTADTRGAFARVFYETLQGSLDAVEVPVSREPEGMMRAFEERGAHEPEDFALLEIDGAPAGMVLVVVTGDSAEIAYLGVVPARRRRGLGTLLASHALARAAAHGARVVRVTVDSVNTPAVAVYERLGFSENRAVRIYYLAKKNF